MTIQVPVGTTDINLFMRGQPAGTTFQFRAGTYRFNTPILPRTGDQFVGTLVGGKRAAIISGANILTNWKFNKRTWFTTGQRQEGELVGDSSLCLPNNPRCNYPEELFINDELKKHVPTLSEVRPGTWFFDRDNDTVYIGDNPKGKLVELSTRGQFFLVPGSVVTKVLIEDLVIEKFASPTGIGAVNLGYSPLGCYDWTIQSSEVRQCHGAGIGNDAETKALYNYVHHNGNFGFFGAGWNIVIEGNEIAYNNTSGHDPYWGAGGSKWVYTSDMIVRGNYSHHNGGPGLWTDINNVRTIYEDNVVEYNALSGIFHEISYEAKIRRNICRFNGQEKRWPWWTANAGISVVSSRNVEVYENHCEENWQEITGLDDGRGDGTLGPWVLDNFNVHHNNTVNTTGSTAEGTGRTGVVSSRPFGFNYNNYRIGPNGTQPFFIDPGFTSRDLKQVKEAMNWAGWQSRGQDVNGTFTRV
jgi:hypothetical protein